jgi:hypothetical protein
MADYIYIVGATKQTIQKVDISDMSKVAESIDYGGTIYAVSEDNTYVYCAGATTQKVYQFLKSDLSKIAESASYGGTIYALTNDTTYVYGGGATTQKIYKWQKSDMAKVAESAVEYAYDIHCIDCNDNYLFVGWSARCCKMDKSTLALLGNFVTSDMTANYTTCVCHDNDYVYTGGLGKRCCVADIVTWTLAYTTLSYAIRAVACIQGSSYFYVATDEMKVDKRLKSDRSLVTQSASYGKTIYALVIDSSGTYLYCGG